MVWVWMRNEDLLVGHTCAGYLIPLMMDDIKSSTTGDDPWTNEAKLGLMGR